ncbi:hypothetical protein BCV70DRAFT_197720 [Testicularia cyperi]|uniref:Uncharacterized protein n=1 Tax=Testicularia cyperi TaxID=1882483 RepID=A0A317XZZ0_9BASI|nr:hypothetical protein BCV70DRAFT_197720 [Testicularia cyperi]
MSNLRSLQSSSRPSCRARMPHARHASCGATGGSGAEKSKKASAKPQHAYCIRMCQSCTCTHASVLTRRLAHTQAGLSALVCLLLNFLCRPANLAVDDRAISLLYANLASLCQFDFCPQDH